MQKMEFDVVVAGRPVAVVVRAPGHDLRRQSDLAYKRGLQSALAKGAVKRSRLKARIDAVWGPAEQAESDRLRAAISADETLLAEHRLAGEESRRVAERLRNTRNNYNQLRRPWLDIEEESAETHALKARIDFVVASCTFHPDGRRYFADAKAYTAMRQQGDPVATRAYWAMTGAVFGWSEDIEEAWPETVILRQHGPSAQAA